MNKYCQILISIFIVGALVWSVNRDFHLSNFFIGDLRNRVVGARLQKDGKSPYFYKWQKKDGIRYYNPWNFEVFAVSASTATPFYHMLLYPLSELQQYTIVRTWLVLQYVLWILCIYLCIRMTVNNVQKLAVMIGGIGILFTQGWIDLIAMGQLYLITPFLGVIFVFCCKKVNPKRLPIIAGTIFIIAVFIRPNFLLFFFPFILLQKKHFNLRAVTMFLFPTAIMLSWLLMSSFQQNLWKDYKRNIDEQIKTQCTGNPTIIVIEKDPFILTWEGMDLQKMNRDLIEWGYVNQSQDTSIFLLSQDAFQLKIPIQILYASFFIIAFAMCVLFYLNNREKKWDVYNLSILGFSLYMLCDYFSPVVRNQYYTVQWLFCLLIAGVIFESRFWKLYLFIFIALIMTVVNIPFIKMEHTIGEYLWLATFFCLSLLYRGQQNIHRTQNLKPE